METLEKDLFHSNHFFYAHKKQLLQEIEQIPAKFFVPYQK